MAAKKQNVAEAIMNKEVFDALDAECFDSTQTVSVFSHSHSSIDLETSFDTEIMEIDTDCSSSEDTVLDSSFHPTETEDFESDRHLPSGAMLIVYWSSLLQLLCKCLRCSADAVIQNVRRCGSASTVKL